MSDITTATAYTLHTSMVTAIDKLSLSFAAGDWMLVSSALADLQNGVALSDDHATQAAALAKWKTDRMIADSVREIFRSKANAEDIRDVLQRLASLMEIVGKREGGAR